MKNNHIFQKQNQSGRSMVEILGVIAIIGVLSIGGIIGYSYGMDKYRANQTIHDITLRGMDIIARSENLTPENYEELNTIWENENSPIYPTDFFYEEEYDRFGIQITGVPSDVCKIIGDNIADYIETRIEIEGEEHEIDDNIEECDLSDDNTMFFFFTDRKCLPECHSNEECIDGKCYGLQCESNADCNKEYDGNCSRCTLGKCDINFNVNGQECTFYDGTLGQCNQGTCVPKSDNGCTYTINPCKDGFYCTASNTSDEVAFQEGETGVCGEPRFDKHVITVDGIRETWYISTSPLSYWDAVAACATKGYDMTGVSNLVKSWSGSSGHFTRNARAEALDTGDYIDAWTTSQTNANKSAFYVSLNTNINNVGAAPKNDDGYGYALCRGVYTETCPIGACHADCPCISGYYCASSNTSNRVEFQAGETGICVEPLLDEVTISVDGTFETWYISSEPISWWDAASACASKGTSLAQASDLVNNWNNNNNWSGTYTSRGTELERLGKSVWLSAHTETSGYFVDFGNGWPNFVIDRWTRNSKKFYALCKKP